MIVSNLGFLSLSDEETRLRLFPSFHQPDSLILVFTKFDVPPFHVQLDPSETKQLHDSLRQASPRKNFARDFHASIPKEQTPRISLRVTNRGEPYRDGIEIGIHKESEWEVYPDFSIFLEHHQAFRIVEWLDSNFPESHS